MRIIGRVLFVAMMCAWCVPCFADDTLRVGKAIANNYDFVPLDVGVEKGFFKAHGIKIEESDFAGSAKLQQALAADAIDVGLGAGTDMAFVAKGNTDLGIAAFAGPPDSQVLVARSAGPVHSAADLKGRKVGISTVGSLTEWLMRRLATQQGWAADAITGVALGSEDGRIASLKVGSTDAMILDSTTASFVEKDGIGKVILHFGSVAPDFIIHAMYARNKVIAEQPDVLKRFLAGWFETIKWMDANKDEAVKIAAASMGQDPSVVAVAYNSVQKDFSTTGRFDPKALSVISHSFVDLKLLPAEPDMSKLYTEEFLPR